MTDLEDRFVGCLLGLALGDAQGAPQEGGMLERLVWRIIGKTPEGEARWTDDTQMSLDLAESIVERGALDQDDVAARFAASYRWSRGYGPGAAKALKKIRRGSSWRDASRAVFPGGSYGNGGAMRAPVIGLAYCREDGRLIERARASAEITHAHPLGIEGAVLVAVGTCTALRGGDGRAILERATEVARDDGFLFRLETARRWFDGERASADEVRHELGTDMTAVGSCVTALYVAAVHLRASFLDLLRLVIRCGGDVDTIAAMAGAIWGAANGTARLPADLLDVLEQRSRIREAGVRLHHVHNSL